MSASSDCLYHIKATLVDYHHDPSGSIQKAAIIHTYSDLITAKGAAKQALPKLGLDMELFESIETRDNQTTTTEEWRYGDGVFIKALTQSEELVTVEIETMADTLGALSTSESNSEEGDDGDDEKDRNQTLFYVLQRTIHYDQDRSGARQTVSIEGVFRNRQEAVEAAKKTLVDEDIPVSEYEEYDVCGGEGKELDWSYGENVVVHAVGKTGQNFEVSVVKTGQWSPA